jgi:hypothetical protein
MAIIIGGDADRADGNSDNIMEGVVVVVGGWLAVSSEERMVCWLQHSLSIVTYCVVVLKWKSSTWVVVGGGRWWFPCTDDIPGGGSLVVEVCLPCASQHDVWMVDGGSLR